MENTSAAEEARLAAWAAGVAEMTKVGMASKSKSRFVVVAMNYDMVDGFTRVRPGTAGVETRSNSYEVAKKAAAAYRVAIVVDREADR